MAQQERDDRPGWYRQAESEFADFFGPEVSGKAEQEVLEDFAQLSEADRAYYQCKLMYLNLRAQYSILRTMQAMLSELKEPADEAPPPRRSRERDADDDQPPAASPKGPSGPVTDISQLPADVQEAIRRHQRPATTPDEVIDPNGRDRE